MGRNIARNESPDEPEKHSRLWASKDICDVLKKKKGTEAVECIIPRDNNQDALRGSSFTTKTFKRMSKLRFLHLEECLPSEFNPSELVILELPGSKLRTVWEQNMVSHVFGNRLTDKHLTKRLFKVYSEFGHQISVYVSKVLDEKSRHRWAGWITESPYWTSESSDSETTVYAHLLPNESHNFMGIILCFSNAVRSRRSSTFSFSVKNTTSGYIWRSGSLDVPYVSEVMVIVPKSISPVRDDDHRIEFTADNNVKIVGIHLLYNTETEIVEEADGNRSN
ncbi:hypothetical protein POM88_020027 [Heracleum sosnowskyi]|uniref:Uncharacterized protein n=1 Tax=Heracleum sosnowskyi TaxID=360622 RepID=A0AAD8MRF8_9APIA|nr:hypothetical protein POM88_020027 [Heracleum sosnowskyi]